eukprot:403373221
MNSSNPQQFMEGFHAVVPKLDCPHCTDENILDLEEFHSQDAPNVHAPCKGCGIGNEVWICLKCKDVYCSRYVNSHMLEHFNKTYNEGNPHPICFSFADFSYWCNLCNEYVEHPLLQHKKVFYEQKFGNTQDQKEILKIIKESKHQDQIKEEDEEQED